MSINLTDELLAKTKNGKIASAKQVFLEGDQENLQQIGDKTNQLEDAFKDITVTGGASTANAVSYNNETSGMAAVTAQGAIDELDAKVSDLEKQINGDDVNRYKLGDYFKGWITSTNKWSKSESSTEGGYLISVNGGEHIKIVASNQMFYAFLKDNVFSNMQYPNYSEASFGRMQLNQDKATPDGYLIPNDTRFVWILSNLANETQDNRLAKTIIIDNWDVINQVPIEITGGLVGDIKELQTSVTAINGDIKELQTSVTAINGDVEELQTSVTAINDDVEELKKQIISEIPDYWYSELDDAIVNINNNEESAKNGSFIFVSDCHYPYNSDLSVAISRYICDKTSPKILINGGDLLQRDHTKMEAIAILRDYSKKCIKNFGQNFRYVLGNHDNNPQTITNDNYKVEDKDVYDILCRPYNSIIVGETNKLNYYWDDATNGIRYVVFNSGTDSIVLNEQLDWFGSMIASIPSGYKIAIFIHAMWTSSTSSLIAQCGYLADMCDAINTRASYICPYNSQTYDFNGSDKKVMFVMCGHIHNDRIENYGVSGFPIIAVACDMWGTGNIGTKNEQKITVCAIDKVQSKLYMCRIGLKPNSYGKTKNKSINIVV